MIYFAQDTTSKAIKIGYSKDPKKRRSGLQTASPNPLELLGVVHGGLEHERAYHKKFKEERIHGEWFHGTILPEVQEIIARNPLDKPPPSNLLVIGDAHFIDRDFMFRALDGMHASNPVGWIVTAGERMLEEWAWEWAKLNRVEVYRYYAKWRTKGRFAGFEVGRRLLRSMFDPKTVVAFLSGGPATNTLDLIRRAKKAGIEVVVHGVQPAVLV